MRSGRGIRNLTCSRRDLIRRAVRAGVGVAGIAAVGCASPEAYNRRDQQTARQETPPSVAQERQPAAQSTSRAVPRARQISGNESGEADWCPTDSVPAGFAGKAVAVPGPATARVVADPEIWRELFHWRTLPVPRGVAPTGGELAIRPGIAAPDLTALAPLLHGQLVVLAAGDGIDAHRAALEGDLAAAWETPDPATISFTLRDDLRWPGLYDEPGPLLAASDIAAVHETLRAPGSPQAAAYRAVAAVTADDSARTVTFSLDEPDASLLLSMTGPGHAIPPPDWNPDDPLASPAGIGPFRLTEWGGPGAPWRLVRSPGYFKRDANGQPLPRIAGIRGGPLASAAGNAGCADTPEQAWGGWLDDSVQAGILHHPGEAVAAMDAIDGAVVQVAAPMPGRGWAFEFPRGVAEPITDPRVRRAVAMALDRRALAEWWENRLAAPDCGMNWTFVEDGRDGFREWPWTEEELGSSYRRDSGAVRDLLAAAGYSRQSPLRLSLLPDTISGRGADAFADLERLATMLATGSSGAIKFAPLTVPNQRNRDEYHFNAETGRAFLAVPDANLALSDGSSLYPVTCDPTTYVPPDAQHRQDTEDTLVADLWQRQRRTIDPAERSQILEALRLRRAELMETVHLINRYGLHMRRPHVHNLVITAFAHHPIQQAKQLERTWLSAENGAG